MQRFSIDFQIFNIHKTLSEKDEIIKHNLINSDLHNILIEAAENIPGWKYLKRNEPAISSSDEKKQLRLDQSQIYYTIPGSTEFKYPLKGVLKFYSVLKPLLVKFTRY
jgi:hypothetical protein